LKQIHLTNNEAPKFEGSGKLKYQLWVDSSGRLYVRIEENAATGTFTPLLFSVVEYADQRNSTKSINKPVGLDLNGALRRESENNNDGAFLKAVLRHLLDV